MLRIIIFNTVFLLTCSYALFRGGRPERWMVLIFNAGRVATWFTITSFETRYQVVEAGVAGVDSACLAAMTILALRVDRFWTMAVAAMQAVSVLAHLAMIFEPTAVPHVYKNAAQLWVYPQMALLALGALRHRLRTSPSTGEIAIASRLERLSRAARERFRPRRNR